MRILVIPDLHNRTYVADRILASAEYDKVVFLGDYFDQFHDSQYDAVQTASWLKRRINEHPNWVFLWGNHDASYRFRKHPCPGWTLEKHNVINSVMHDQWDKLKLAHWEEGYLFSHAGVSADLFGHPVYGMTVEHILKTCDKALELADAGLPCPYLDWGRDRGGTARFGGIDWMDWSSFVDYSDIPQIVGHTPDKAPRKNGNSWCIDTHTRHYAIVEDGRVEICPTQI